MHDVDIFIGEKLHSVVLALCTYTPSIMISYAPKCDDFMESVNLHEYTIRTDQLDIERTLYMIESFEVDIPAYQQRIYEEINALKKKFISSATELNGLLNKT